MNTLVSREEYEDELSDSIVSNKNFYGFLFQGFFYGAVVGCISLLIPLYAIKLNATAVQIGLIAGSRGMGHFLLVVPVGILLDRFGIKKIFTIASFISFIVVLSIPIAPTPKILLLFSLVEGLTCSTRLTALNAWSFGLLPFLKPSQMGWYKGVSGMGTTITGPIVGSLLAEKLGFNAAFACIAIVILIVNLIELFFGTSPKGQRKVSEKSEGVLLSLIKLLKMFKNPRLLFAAFAESLNSAFTSCFRILIILLIIGFMHKSSSSVSLVTSFVGVTYLIVLFFGGFVLNYVKSTVIYIIGSSAIIIALITMAVTVNIVVISFAALLAGLGMGYLSLVNYKTISRIKGDSGKLSGVITFSTGVTLCMAPMIVSCVVEMSSLKAGFLALMLPFLLLGVLVIFKKAVQIRFKMAREIV